MSAQAGVTLVKRFTYRGDATEEFSNTYWFTGSVPADATAWRALVDALIVAEKPCYPAAVTVVRAYGYADNTGHMAGDPPPASPAVYTLDLTVSPETPVAGTLVTGGVAQLAGDAAIWARWKTSRLTEKGKAIYLRKYFHGVISAGGDTYLSTQKNNLLALGAKLDDGSFIDARKVTAAGQTDVITSHGASTYVTVRTLKRRGKREAT